MLRNLIIFLTLFALSVSATNCSKNCAEDDLECHEKLKYTKEENQEQEIAPAVVPNKWQKYIDKINKALAEYKECKSTNCSCYKRQLDIDLEPWKRDGISREMFQESLKIERISHYQIIDHKLYRNEEAMFPFRNSGIEHFILKIIDRLPNTEFILNTRDWPSTNKYAGQRLPIFSFSKVMNHHFDIMYPAWTFWEGGPAVWPIYPSGLGRWDEQLKIIPKAAKQHPWEYKETKAFFRGSRTSEERDPLVLLSRAEPNLVEASFTKNQAWRSDADTLGAKPAEEIKLEDHCKYKYLFNFRGVAASFRFKHLFLCNSLVFHVGDEWLEFFYDALKPWVHYIPVRQDLTDARQLIEFAIENDQLAKEIAKRGQDFVMEHLKMEEIYCYWEELIKEYTKLLRFKPKLNKKHNRIV